MIFENMNEAYPELMEYVQINGLWYAPRDQACKEVRPASFVLNDPLHALYTGVERRLNFRFHVLETLLYTSGLGDSAMATLLCRVNSNMKQFVNPSTKTFDGFYGPRLADGLAECYDVLKSDPWTRQAVASIWNNVEERMTRDLPCTLSFQFFCTKEDNEYDETSEEPTLNLSVTMRSNDLNWGMPYDVAAFNEILLAMCGCLGYRLGKYFHNVGSLHYYKETPPTLRSPETNHVGLEDGIKGVNIADYYKEIACAILPQKQSWYSHVEFTKNILEALLSYSYTIHNGDSYPWDDNGFHQKMEQFKITPWAIRQLKMVQFNWKRDYIE